MLTSLKEHPHLKTFRVSLLTLNMEAFTLFECLLESNKHIENLTMQNCLCEEIFNVVREEATSLRFHDIHSSKISFHHLI